MRNKWATSANNAMTKNYDALTQGLQAIYWLAKEGMPISKFPPFINFLKFIGVNELRVGNNATYSPRWTADEFTNAMYCTIKEDIDHNLQSAEYISILIMSQLTSL